MHHDVIKKREMAKKKNYKSGGVVSLAIAPLLAFKRLQVLMWFQKTLAWFGLLTTDVAPAWTSSKAPACTGSTVDQLDGYEHED